MSSNDEGGCQANMKVGSDKNGKETTLKDEGVEKMTTPSTDEGIREGNVDEDLFKAPKELEDMVEKRAQ